MAGWVTVILGTSGDKTERDSSFSIEQRSMWPCDHVAVGDTRKYRFAVQRFFFFSFPSSLYHRSDVQILACFACFFFLT